MSNPIEDVIVVGAGAAGIAAARELSSAGLRVVCLEARDRMGGRIWTIHPPQSAVPVELGAEFIHGPSPEIFDAARRASLAIRPTEGRFVSRAPDRGASFEAVDRVMDDIRDSANEEKDESFSSFLARSSYSEQVKRAATAYVEGFNAARADKISVASLAEDLRGAEAIGGDSSYRFVAGYDALVSALAGGIDIRLNSVVHRIEWQRGAAAVHVRSALDASRTTFETRRVIVTVPLGVLQGPPDGDGAIRFEPEPVQILEAARALEVGQAVRVVLRFAEPFWEQDSVLAGAGFLLSDEPMFPTWWTTLPLRAPVITGWSAGPKTDPLLGRSEPELVSRALASLSRIAGVPLPALESAHVHDWQADPFARGAYSYVPAGALPARRALAEPVAQTLYFAGEATDLEGHSATVHGALALGKRAARQVLDS